MTGKNLSKQHLAAFEAIRQRDATGTARELAPLLDYVQWRSFVMDKARGAC